MSFDKPAPAESRGPDVQLAPVLLRVRLLRQARITRWVTLVALIAWLIALIIIDANIADGSAPRPWFDAHGNRGFVGLLIVLGVSLLVDVGIRPAGRAGRLASQLVPILRRAPDPLEAPDHTAAGGRTVAGTSRRTARVRLLDLGSRRTSIAPGRGSRAGTVVLVLVLLVVAGVGSVAGARLPSDYRAAHGSGGPTVTMGVDSHVTRRVLRPDHDRYPVYHYDYYISSPRGEALAQGDGRPHDGDRFVVVRSLGGLQAVHRGGHAWVTALVLTILAVLLGCLLLGALLRRGIVRVRHSRARDDRIVPLADTLATLWAGGRVAVRPGAGRPASPLSAASSGRAAQLGASDPAKVAAALRRHDLLIGLAVTGGSVLLGLLVLLT